MDRPARLTTDFVKKVDRKGRYGDGRGGHGLSLLVRPVKGGFAKNWQQRVRVNGKVGSLGLGSFPNVKLNTARDLATENVFKIRERFPRRTGIDLLLKEADLLAVTSASTGPTFADVAEEFIVFQRTSWKHGSKTEKQTRARLARYVIPALGDIAIEQVTPAQVVDVLSPIWHQKKETARKTMRNIRAVFEFAVGKSYTARNPTSRALTGLGSQRRVVQHHPAVPFSKVGEVLEYVRNSGSYESKRLAFEFLVLAAARTSEVRGARWDEIDLDEATWTIPARRMKNDREHRVPLSTAALGVLRRARRVGRGGCYYLKTQKAPPGSGVILGG